MVADTPGLSGSARRLHRKSPVPYRPMRLSLMRKQLEPFGRVTISCYALESMWFNQHVSEYRAPGRRLWQLIHGLERRYARHIARLGNYVQIVLNKH
jgi:hypothetical protein